MSTEVDWESSSLGHISTFIVKGRPLVAVVIITTAKEEVRMNSRLIRRRGGRSNMQRAFYTCFFLIIIIESLFIQGRPIESKLPFTMTP